MTPYERVHRRLRGEPVDRVPNLNILMAFAARYVGAGYDDFCRDHRYLVDANLKCNEAFGIDMLNTMSDPLRETADLGARIVWRPDAIPECAEPLVAGPKDVSRLRLFDPLASTRMLDRLRAIEAYRRAAVRHYSILGWVEGPLAEAADLRGVSDLMTDILVEPDFVRELMSFCRDQGVLCAAAQVQAGADFIGVGDAVASLVSPEVYRELVVPLERSLFDAIHAAGAKVKLHVCGDITHLLDDMATTGADIIDVDCPVDFGSAVARLSGRASPNGNVDPVRVVYQGTPADIRAAARRCLDVGDARTFVSAGCEIPRDTPLANLHAFDEALRES